jgi:lysophospholipase L1-like esterase
MRKMEINSVPVIDPAQMEVYIPILQAFLEIGFDTRWKNFDELNRMSRPGGVVFVGDSITEAFPIHEFFLCDRPLYNRGVSGVTAKQILEHVRAHVGLLDPSMIFILIGTNDLGNHEPADSVIGSIRGILQASKDFAPNAQICLVSVFPVSHTARNNVAGTRSNKVIRELNGLMQKLTDEFAGVAYIDLYRDLADEKGRMKSEYTYDGLHLTAAGYKVVADALARRINGGIA